MSRRRKRHRRAEPARRGWRPEEPGRARQIAPPRAGRPVLLVWTGTTAARSFPPPLNWAARRRQPGSLTASALAQRRLVVGEPGRLPNLKILAQPDKRRAFGNVGMLDKVLGEDDAAFGIERQRLR